MYFSPTTPSSDEIGPALSENSDYSLLQERTAKVVNFAGPAKFSILVPWKGTVPFLLRKNWDSSQYLYNCETASGFPRATDGRGFML
jgi:hypothetical protein